MIDDPTAAARSPSGDDPVREVFNHWRDATGHQAAKFSDERRRVIKNRLRDNSPFHMGANDGCKKYDGLDLIFRNPTKVEEFMQMASDTRGDSAPVSVTFDPTRQRRSEIHTGWLADEITEAERDRLLEALGGTHAL